jgi:hypothetical protein
MTLSPPQQLDLTALYYGAFLVHSRSDDAWYLYNEGETADQVDPQDAEGYIARGWVERQGYESSVNLELYALTTAGEEAVGPYLTDPLEDPAARLLLSARTTSGQTFLLAVPVSTDLAETLRRRFVLAETLTAADDDFVALEYSADVAAFDPNLADEVAELYSEAQGAALLAQLPEGWNIEAEAELDWASVLVSESGFAFTAGLSQGERLETDELTEEELLSLVVTLLQDEPSSPQA